MGGRAPGHLAALRPRPPLAAAAHLRPGAALQRAAARAVRERGSRRRHPAPARLRPSSRKAAVLAGLPRLHLRLVPVRRRRDPSRAAAHPLWHASPRRRGQFRDGGGAGHRRAPPALHPGPRRNRAGGARRDARRAAHHRVPGDGRRRPHRLLRGGGHRRYRFSEGSVLRRAPGGPLGHARESAAPGPLQRDRLRRHGRGAALAPARPVRPARRGPMSLPQGVRAGLLVGAVALGLVPLSGDRTAAYAAIWVALVLSFLLLRRVVQAPFGHVLTAIRINEGRMRTLGYGTGRYKLAAFVLGGVLAGLAGYLDATLYGFVNPAQFGWRQSGLVLVTVLLGGKGTLYGPALGAALLSVLEHFAERATEHWSAVVGAAVIAVVLFLPRGVAGLLEGSRG